MWELGKAEEGGGWPWRLWWLSGGEGGGGGEGAVLTCFIKLTSLLKPNGVAVEAMLPALLLGNMGCHSCNDC